MSRRTRASLLAAGLLVVVLTVMTLMSVPYVTITPGPTVDVLGEREGEPVLTVEGAKTYPTEGELRLTTILVTPVDREVSLFNALSAWMRDDTALIPYEAMYPEGSTREQEETISAAQMVNSQDSAVAAALSELGYELERYVEITGVSPGGPSKGELKVGDRVLEVAGQQVTSLEELFGVLDGVEPGDEVTVVVQRDGEQRSFDLTTTAADDDPERAIIGVLVGTGFEFPFEVEIGIDESIGGPSAGLMFALAVYDELTPGALTGGNEIAGTGTITPEGEVGPIGGIQQKIEGAAQTGSALFLVPPANCDQAVRTDADIELVRADTLASAVQSLETYAEDPAAELPRCPE